MDTRRTMVGEQIADQRDKDTLASIVCSVGSTANSDPPQVSRRRVFANVKKRRGPPA